MEHGDGGTCFKTDFALRELQYVQVEAPRMAYLFFYDRHGCWHLMQNAMEMVCMHIAESFMEWIGWSADFNADPIPLEEGWHLAMVAQERCRQHSRIQDIANQPTHPVTETSSGSSLQLVGGAPPMPESQEGATTLAEQPWLSLGRMRCHPKTKAAKE